MHVIATSVPPPIRPALPPKRSSVNLTTGQKLKLWLAAAIFSAMAWGVVFGAAVLVCRWVDL